MRLRRWSHGGHQPVLLGVHEVGGGLQGGSGGVKLGLGWGGAGGNRRHGGINRNSKGLDSGGLRFERSIESIEIRHKFIELRDIDNAGQRAEEEVNEAHGRIS